MDRRTFILTLGAGALTLPALSWGTAPLTARARYYSARTTPDGRYFVSGFDDLGRLRFDTQLPGRGHGLAVQPTHIHLVAVARRPGTYLVVMDATSGEVIHRQESKEGRHFYGHSFYSPDGRWFYTPENNIETGQGVIGIRDVAQGYKQVNEFSSHGIGPHEIALLKDGRTLVVANGGILTKPETGRSKLNLSTMSPSLAYLDTQTGKLLEEQKLHHSLHRNSIRHLAVNSDDTVCFAMQYQGRYDGQGEPPLVGMHRRGEEVKLLSAPAGPQVRMHNYCGSVCTDTSGQWFAVSAPKGGLVTFWSISDGSYGGHVEVADGCGIAAGLSAREFILSSGAGGVYSYRVGDDKPEALARISSLDTRWDNHISRVAL